MREMKDSGFGYLGNIPATWRTERVKNHLRFSPEKNPGRSIVLSLYREYGIVPKDSRDDNYNVTSEDTSNYRYVHVGDFVVNKMKAWQGSMGVSAYEGIVSPAYFVYRFTTDEFDVRYLHYLLRSKCYADEFRRLSGGIRIGQWDLPKSGFETTYVAIPPKEEQAGIADFIETKTSQVDTLISNVQSQIEKLKAYKQSMITEVVTKGIDPTVPMKDSGVKWIGVISKDFNIVRLKNIAEILDQYRKPITADQRSQDGDVLYDYYGASGVIDKIDGYTIDDHVMLIGEDGANLRVRNLPLMYELNGKAWINNHAHILKPKASVLFYYLFYVLEGLDINPYITGSAQPKLNQENLKTILIPLPSLKKQEKIVEFIMGKHQEINRLIAIKQAKIEKLSEYKKSLIYEYVTGKKEVQ